MILKNIDGWLTEYNNFVIIHLSKEGVVAYA